MVGSEEDKYDGVREASAAFDAITSTIPTITTTAITSTTARMRVFKII
jgi:hypothetical protein